MELPPEIWKIILKDDILQSSSGMLRHVCRMFRDILHNKYQITFDILSSVPIMKWAYANGCPLTSKISN